MTNPTDSDRATAERIVADFYKGPHPNGGRPRLVNLISAAIAAAFAAGIRARSNPNEEK